MKESDYYCAKCGKSWEDAEQPYCERCGSPYRDSTYGLDKDPKPKRVKK